MFPPKLLLGCVDWLCGHLNQLTWRYRTGARGYMFRFLARAVGAFQCTRGELLPDSWLKDLVKPLPQNHSKDARLKAHMREVNLAYLNASRAREGERPMVGYLTKEDVEELRRKVFGK